MADKTTEMLKEYREKNLKLLKELRKEGKENGVGSRGVRKSDTKLQSAIERTTSQRWLARKISSLVPGEGKARKRGKAWVGYFL